MSDKIISQIQSLTERNKMKAAQFEEAAKLYPSPSLYTAIEMLLMQNELLDILEQIRKESHDVS